jgi:hypothetical protein
MIFSEFKMHGETIKSTNADFTRRGAGSGSTMAASSLMLKPSVPAPHDKLVCSIAGKTKILGV